MQVWEEGSYAGLTYPVIEGGKEVDGVSGWDERLMGDQGGGSNMAWPYEHKTQKM